MWPSGKAQDLGPTGSGFDPHRGTLTAIIKQKFRSHYKNQRALVSSPLLFERKGGVLLCREVSPVWMRIRLRFQPKQRRKGKKDINFVGQKFGAPGGNGTCVDRKGKKDINFGRQKFRAPGGTGTCLLERSKGKKN